MWKDFFNFTKRERITVAVLTSIIFVVQILIWTTDRWLPLLPEELQNSRKKELALRQVMDSIVEQNRISQTGQTSGRTVPEKAETFMFDPNTADSLTFRRLGFNNRVIRNILKYRSKGGSFKKPTDLSRIYGMDATLYSRLERFIQLDSGGTGASNQAHGGTNGTYQQQSGSSFTDVGSEQDHRVETIPTIKNASQKNNQEEATGQFTGQPLGKTVGEVTRPVAVHNFDQTSGQMSGVIEINKVDTSQLLLIKGVGKLTAERIISYRKSLGGFYQLSQLDEIKGLYPETKQRLMSMLSVDARAIRTLSVNKLPLEAFRKHPYISFWQAKVLVELRKARGRIESIEELSAFKEFKKEDLERLKWYLSFQ